MNFRKHRLKLFLVIIFATSLAFYFFKNSKSELKDSQLLILSYSNFNSLLGPGKDLKKKFEEQCHCRVRIINGGEAALILKKLKYLDKVDVVVGLDQFLIDRAQMDYEWVDLEVESQQFLPEIRPLITINFLPFDWSPMTFLFRPSAQEQNINNLSSLSELTALGLKNSMSLQDPRTSTPGLHLLWWISTQEQPRKILQQLKIMVHSVSPSWSSSYGLFQQKQVNFTFSYLTSLLYHWGVEGNMDYAAFKALEGHPYQVEFLGVPKKCNNCLLAKEFVNFMLSKEAQSILKHKNYMFSVLQSAKDETMGHQLPDLTLLTPQSLLFFRENIEKYFKLWDEIILE